MFVLHAVMRDHARMPPMLRGLSAGGGGYVEGQDFTKVVLASSAPYSEGEGWFAAFRNLTPTTASVTIWVFAVCATVG